MNGRTIQAGPTTQFSQAATQLTSATMWNQPSWTANNSCQYRTMDTDTGPTPKVHFTVRDGAFSNRQMSNWNTSAVPHQAVSSKQPTAMLLGFLQKSFENTSATNGIRVASQQDFYQTSSIQSPPYTMQSNTTYPQQDMSGHCNQQSIVHGKQSVRTDNRNCLSESQHIRGLGSVIQNIPTKSMSAHPSAANSLPHQQVGCTNTVVSATAHNRGTTFNQNYSIKEGLPSYPPPRYNISDSESFRNNNVTTCSSSTEQISHFSGMGQKIQQHPIYPNSTHNKGVEAFLSKTNEHPLNPNAYTQERMFSHKAITRMAVNQHESFSSTSDSCLPMHSSSPYRWNQSMSKVRMTENMKNVKMTERYNLNALQSLPVNSELSKATHSPMPRAQHSVYVPQQRFVRNDSYVTTTADKSGYKDMEANTVFPKSNNVSKVKLVGSTSPSDASQLMKLPESISPQKEKTQSLVANTCKMLEMSEMFLPMKVNNVSIPSSTGCTGMKAVAVVQPLSQESHQVTSKHTSSNTSHSQLAKHTEKVESLSNPEKSFISPAVAENDKALHLREGSNIYPDHQNEMRSNKSVISYSSESSDSMFLSSADSAGHQELTQKKLCTDDTGSKLVVGQRTAPTAQQSLTPQMLLNQRGNNDKSQSPADPNSRVDELSSIPTILWTAVALKNAIEDAEKAELNVDRNVTMFEPGKQLLRMFWNGDSKHLTCLLKSGWYKDLMDDVNTFCNKHLKPDSVILTQVSFEEQLKNYHVLKEDTVYSESPFKSSWLNFNKQLDDIDKEFGFPLSLKHCLHIFESYSQADQVGTVNNMSVQRVSEVPNKVLLQTELEQDDSAKEIQPFTIEVTSTQTTSPNKTESTVSSDPYYSFEIQVLPPEEAKIIFEQAQSKMPPSMDAVSKPERDMNSSAEDKLPEAVDVTLKDTKLDKSIRPIEQICCVFNWLEKVCGPDTPYLNECQCTCGQSLTKGTDTSFSEAAMTLQKKDNLFPIRLDNKLHTEGEQGKENIAGNKNMTNYQSCREVSQTIAVTENNHKSLFNSENEVEDLSSSESQTKLDKKIENLPSSESEVASQMSVLEEHCGAQLTSTDVAESILKTDEQNQTRTTAAPLTTSSLSGFFPVLKKTRKCKLPVDVDSQPLIRRKALSDAADSKPLASNISGVQLVLFGSAQKDNSVLIRGRKRNISSQEGVCDGVPEPPEFLFVKPGLLRKRKSCEQEQSVKRWSHDKWKSFSITKVSHKLKTPKYTCSSLSGLSPKKAAKVGLSNTEKLPVSSEMKTLYKTSNRCLSLKRRGMSLSGAFKHEEEMVKKDVVTFKQPAHEARSKAESGNQAGKPLHKNHVLRFSVLPNTFSFKDGFSERKETNEPPAKKMDLVGGMNKSLNKKIARQKGTWYPKPEKKCCPLRTPPVLQTSSLFHEFQKKYRKRTQPSTAD